MNNSIGYVPFVMTTGTSVSTWNWSGLTSTTGASISAIPSEPRAADPLGWLDAEIEAVCALARVSQ